MVPPVPTIGVAPTVFGTAQSGETLGADRGAWTNNPTQYAIQWKRCNADGNGCSNLAGETGTSHNVVDADVGRRLVIEVIASNAGGASAPVVSSPSDIVLAAPVSTFGTVKTHVGRDGVIRLSERAHDPGKYSWAATFKKSAHGPSSAYGKGSLATGKPGTVVLTVRPTTRARHALSAVHKLRVRITVTFKSALGGSPRSQVKTLIVSSR